MCCIQVYAFVKPPGTICLRSVHFKNRNLYVTKTKVILLAYKKVRIKTIEVRKLSAERRVK